MKCAILDGDMCVLDAIARRDSAALLHQTQNTGVSKLVLIGIQVLVQATQHFRRKQLGWCCQKSRQHHPLIRLDEERVVHGVAIVVATEVAVGPRVHEEQLPGLLHVHTRTARHTGEGAAGVLDDSPRGPGD
eukprot:356027-Chlamydomonas_euryale.AAC.5